MDCIRSWTRTLTILVILCVTTALAAQDEMAIIPDNSVPLNPDKTVYFDKSGQRLWLRTELCLREGELEMFICPKQTKEHESVLNFAGEAHVLHAGLVALGAKPGKPAELHPEFQAATGTEIQIFVNWQDEEGEWQRERAQHWIRHATQTYFSAPLAALPMDFTLIKARGELTYDAFAKELVFFGPMSSEQKTAFLGRSTNADYHRAIEKLAEQGVVRPMTSKFVFSGSRFVRMANGDQIYQANLGSLVCVANFADAMIDINSESTANNTSGLLFEPWTERLPELHTKVIVEMIPVLEKTPVGSSSPMDSQPATVSEE